jgi:hypothetical protein
MQNEDKRASTSSREEASQSNTKPTIMTMIRQCAGFALITTALSLASCASNDEFEDRMDDRSDWYSNLQDRRQMRQDARQDRTDAWFDRVMH